MSSTTTATRTSKASAKRAAQNESFEKSRFKEFNVEDVLISSQCGSGNVKKYHQRRTMAQYAFLVAAGLATFYKTENPQLRAAGLGLLFPGAGFIAVCTIPSILAFILTLAAVPVILFMWFGCGGLAFPLALWIGSTLAASFLARETVFESAGTIVTAACILGISYIVRRTQTANAEAEKRRDDRNTFLVNAVQENHANAPSAPIPGSREADERSLRFLQWVLEMGLTPQDDFSYHDVIDQFQTAAIRYQLWGAQWELALYQSTHCPNFHGYLSQAQRNLIDKSMTKKAMNFWKWESLLGKFTLDWDPIREDNIMVSGYILLSVALYQIATGDDRYAKKDSMEFVVTENARYKYNLDSIAKAVFRNMDQNRWNLYPCEPNWIYTTCNFIGISGIMAGDKVLGTGYGDKLKSRFDAALKSEFSNADGTILPIRSELTGFTIPGLAGAISDAAPAVFCGPYLPHIGHRHWALMKRDNVRWSEDGQLELANLVGADNIDPGNYKNGRGYVRNAIANAASEYGEYEIRDELVRQMDEEHFPVYETKTGALKNKGLSTLGQCSGLRSRLGARGDWDRLLTEGTPAHCFRAPILDKVSFPDVLVAKAYSQDGKSVELVLYNGKQPGVFELGFKNMQPSMSYKLEGQIVKADAKGEACFTVEIDGRTAMKLEPVSQ